MSVQDHSRHTKSVGNGALVYVKPFVPNLIVLVLANESHLVAANFYVPFQASAVSDIKDTRSIAVNLDGILSGVPASAKVIIFRGKLFLKTGSEQQKQDKEVTCFHKKERML